MNTENKSTAQSAPGDLLLTRVFNAPRELVFKAWIDPIQLAQWWGPGGFTNPRCEWDVRPGGLIRVDMRAPNGTVYPMSGTYLEILEPERLVFKCGALDGEGKLMFEILNTVTFAEEEGRTTLTLQTHVIETTADAARYLNGHAKGWEQSLKRFDAFVQQTHERIAATENSIEEPGSDREIIISRVFHVPREMLWEAMTNPLHVVNWWGPRGFTTTIQQMDVRPGGAWLHTMRGPDGTEYPNRSLFNEVVRPERLTFSNGGERKGGPGISFESTWTFDALDEMKSKVTIHMVFPSAEAREMVVKEFGAIEGGKQTLGRLAEQVAQAPVIIERVFDAPVGTVWKAISEPDQLRKWYFDIENFAAVVGAEFDFCVEHEGDSYHHLCRVTEVDPGRKLAYTWRYEGQEGDSLVTFELIPEGERTRLKLTHEGLETFPKIPDYARENFMKGWTAIIGTHLREFLSSNIKEQTPS